MKKNLLILSLISLIIACDEPAEQHTTKIVHIDSLLTQIKKDSLYKVTDVVYQDSTIQIAVKDPEPGTGTVVYFDKIYHLTDYDNIEDVEIYKGRIQKDPLQSYGKRINRELDQFKKQFIYAVDGSCLPLEQSIKKMMNDPDSYEHVSTSVDYIRKNRFMVSTQFRGKNAFGGKILNSLAATLDGDGNVLTIK